MGVSHLILILGLTITTFVALLQQSNVKNTRQLTFDAAAAYVQEELVDAVNTEVLSFQSEVNFISATHPGPLDQYRAYFSSRRATPVSSVSPVSSDPGFTLIEVVPPDDLGTLVERERALGNDFAPLVLSASDTDALIVTRTARDASVLGLPLIGLDISALREDTLLKALISAGDLAMIVVPSAEISGLIGLPPGAPLDDVDPSLIDGYADFTAFIAGEVYGSDGQFIGFSLETQQISQLLGSVTDADLKGLSVELYVSGIPESIVGRLSPNAPAIDDAGLRATREITTASLDWRIEVWADDDFGPATGLFDQAWVWITGVMATVAAYAASVRRQLNRQRLDKARFELAHARTMAMTDPLTGLLNRNGLVEAARGFGSDTAATVFFIDLDGFKAVNDNSGHDIGDEVLRAVADRLTAIFRAEDLISRLGGDEFVVFTDHQGPDFVTKVCTRITESISDIDERVSCSLGVASRSADQRTDIKDLLRAADVAMYEAKRSGGDRFSLSGTTPT